MKHTHEIALQGDLYALAFPAKQMLPAHGNLQRMIFPLVAVAGLFCSGAVAHAGTIVNVTFQGHTPNATPISGMGVRLYDSLNSSVTPNSSAATNVRLYDGAAFDFKVNNPTSMQFMGPGGVSSSTGILSYCIAMTENFQYGPTNLAMISLASGPAQMSVRNVGGMGAASAMPIEELWGKHINNVLNPPPGLTNSQAAGAFQLAVWKLEHDGKNPFGTPGSVNFGKGYVEATTSNASDATILNTASNWINSLSLNPSSGELANLAAISGPNYQDQVLQINQNQSVTPEPTSNLIWLVVAAIGVYPIMRRRSNAV